MSLIRKTRPHILITILTLLFCFSIALNITPYLRGFAPYPQWLWQYRPVMLNFKIMFPLLVLFCILLTARSLMNKSQQYLLRHEKKLLLVILLLCLLFQLSVIFAGTGGLPILLERTINPLSIGYFGASLTIRSLQSFFYDYPHIISSYPTLAKFHPPGAVLLFWLINQLSSPLTHVINLTPHLQSSQNNLQILWNGLAANEKVGAVVSGYIVMFLAALTTIPIYYLGKLGYTPKVGIQAAILFILLPGLAAFLPVNDIFSPLFTAASFYYYLKGFKKRSLVAFALSGTILFFGAFFTLTILSVLLIYIIAAIHYIGRNRLTTRQLLLYICAFTTGLLILPLVLYLVLGFNSAATIMAILSGHSNVAVLRQLQPLWLIYNYYDFFLFSGIPLLVLFILLTKDTIKSLVKKQYTLDVMFAAFCLLTLLIDVTGIMNGETGRTWTAFIPFILLPLVNYLDTSKKGVGGYYYLVILLLQGLQVLTLTTYLVTVL